MNLNAYTIYDQAPQVYNRPFFAQSDAEALRHFDDMSVAADHPVSAHPEHYYLYRIGVYDQSTGKITAEEPKCLATAVERVAAQQKIEAGSLTNVHEISPGGTD